ncbi:MAG: MBL fold metallo-hydrolase, partial [Thermoanaerobaculia bacterium]
MRTFLLTLGVFGSVLLAGCGHVIRQAPNHGNQPFDFKQPPCKPAASPKADDGTVAIRYLGAGGLAIRWQGQVLLTAPFFSHYGFPRVPFGHLKPDRQAIKDGMAPVVSSEVGAILAGHSHYDHLGDLPIVARMYAPRARVYVNDSGLKLLNHTLGSRLESLEEHLGKPVQLRDAQENRLPFRVTPVESEHAPHLFRFHWAGGPVKEFWNGDWDDLRLWHMRSGTTLAFVIDLMDGDQVRYRIYYQDAASPRGKGAPPVFAPADRHPVDLAVLCMPGHQLVENAPEWLLRQLNPRHVLAIHYENFFEEDPMRFVPMLTDRLANDYLGCIDEVLGESA